MEKVFISQPMNGKTEEEILKEREKAFRKVKEWLPNEEIVAMDSTILTTPPEGVNEDLWRLGKALQIMAGADVVYFARGWGNARGCTIEHDCAAAYGKQIIDMDII